MKATVKDLVNSIQEKRMDLAREEEMLEHYKALGEEDIAQGCRESVDMLKDEISDLMKQLRNEVTLTGSLPQEVSIEGRHMFLEREEIPGTSAFYYQASDVQAPDIYVEAENLQAAGEKMALELISRGITW